MFMDGSNDVGVKSYDYRLVEKTLRDSITYDEGHGSKAYADVSCTRTRVIAEWSGDEWLGLALRCGEVDDLVSDYFHSPVGSVEYNLERKLSGTNDWQYHADATKKPSVSELPKGYNDFPTWLAFYWGH